MKIYKAETYTGDYNEQDNSDFVLYCLGYFKTEFAAKQEIEADILIHELLNLKGKITEIEVRD